MTLTHEDVQTWLDRYVEAWRTYEPAAIRDLFSEDAEYRYHPWDEPVSGRDAILHDWVEPAGDASTRDTPGTYDARYEPWVVEGDRAVAVGVSDGVGVRVGVRVEVGDGVSVGVAVAVCVGVAVAVSVGVGVLVGV